LTSLSQGCKAAKDTKGLRAMDSLLLEYDFSATL
jgi:hypothetical protein